MFLRNFFVELLVCDFVVNLGYLSKTPSKQRFLVMWPSLVEGPNAPPPSRSGGGGPSRRRWGGAMLRRREEGPTRGAGPAAVISNVHVLFRPLVLAQMAVEVQSALMSVERTQKH